MKNGIKRHMNDPYNIGPVFGQRILLGPDIEWRGQKYSSPYQLPVTRPTWWNGPDRPDFTRGRHPFRTLPRGEGYPSPSINPNTPPYAHGVGSDGLGIVIRGLSGGCQACGDDVVGTKTPWVAYALIGVLAYGVYRAAMEVV